MTRDKAVATFWRLYLKQKFEINWDIENAYQWKNLSIHIPWLLVSTNKGVGIPVYTNVACGRAIKDKSVFIKLYLSFDKIFDGEICT